MVAIYNISMYNWVPAFRTTLDSTIHKFQADTSCFLRLQRKTPATEMVNFISKPGVFFMGIQLNGFINSYISCGMAPSHIIGASDFAIRKVSFITQTKIDYPL